MPSRLPVAALASASLLLAGGVLLAQSKKPTPAASSCHGDNGGITLPPGFCATIFADNLGHTRHMVVAKDGTVYVNTWSGRYFRNAPPAPPGGFLVGLKDRDGDGVSDVSERFGGTESKGQHGGTGIALWKGFLFAEENDTIVRYALKPGQIAPGGAPATILTGMPESGDHPMHPFVIDGNGQILVNSGSATNTCESPNRQPGAKGAVPCVEAETRGGIWAYRGDRTGQVFSAKERWASGIRNTGGMAFDAAGRLYGVQHGRDQLAQNWPKLYTTEEGVERPGEILMALTRGVDYGWPTCYFDPFTHKQVLAPEYGGNGRTQGICAGKAQPLAAYPAHWAPMDVTIHTGQGFPAAYAQGAFIAFHGSWNRAPAPQDGFMVAFQPMKDSKPDGKWIRFADGFAGAYREPGRAEHRPAGLAVGPDGALYISDDVRGRIWRVTYSGPANAPLADAPKAEVRPDAADAAPTDAALPAGVTAQQVALGRAIFRGEAKGGTCAGCHGSDAKGSSAGPSLVGPAFLWSDGSVKGLAHTITTGVPQPKRTSVAMPALGGADLAERDVDAVAAYVWTLGHTAR